jgi:hypothetical protein
MDIYNKFILIFILCYCITFLRVIANPEFEVIWWLDVIHYFSVFLIVPFLITVCINRFVKYDFIKLYFIIFVIQWILYLNVNPYPLPLDNKFSIMELVPEHYRPHTQFLLASIYQHDFNYPIVIKPICCTGNSINVLIINDEDELHTFIARSDIDIHSYMVQEYIEDTIEFGILYEKYPFENTGRILEIVEKISSEDIIHFNDRYKKSYDHLVNNENINMIISEITNLIPGMNVARYDIRVKNIDDLEKGDFKIIEINGTMGWSLKHYIDSTWYVRRLFIGLCNTISLKGYSIIELPIVMYRAFFSMITCFDCENLFSLYS